MKIARDFDKNKHYLEIGFKWGDCKKYFNCTDKFIELEPQFMNEYKIYFTTSHKGYAGAFCQSLATPNDEKIKIFNKIINIKRKYKSKILLVTDFDGMELTINELKKWFIDNNDFTLEQIKELK